MRNRIVRGGRIAVLLALATLLASCEPPQVYGSIGYSTYSGGGYYGGGPAFGGSISLGGRIF